MRKVIIVLIDQSINTQTNAIHKNSPTTKAEECGLFENEEGGANVAENGTFTAVLGVGSDTKCSLQMNEN